MIYNREYLVMPIYRPDVSSEPVFYSARCLTDCKHSDGFVPPKYSYPLNRKKEIWRSWDFAGESASVPINKHVLVGEGVADAVWLSQLGPSVALLGSHGDLDRPFILVLDGDERGITAAFDIVQTAKRKGLVDAKTVVLPHDLDPTDVSVKDLQKMILEQAGVI